MIMQYGIIGRNGAGAMVTAFPTMSVCSVAMKFLNAAIRSEEEVGQKVLRGLR
jgi:hypothetical protein